MWVLKTNAAYCNHHRSNILYIKCSSSYLWFDGLIGACLTVARDVDKGAKPWLGKKACVNGIMPHRQARPANPKEAMAVLGLRLQTTTLSRFCDKICPSFEFLGRPVNKRKKEVRNALKSEVCFPVYDLRASSLLAWRRDHQVTFVPDYRAHEGYC